MSFLDYKGNKSTSLMARDLLTSEEVKQLHYKTIIFPIIGYLIFRDTNMYNKFSCYQKGAEPLCMTYKISNGNDIETIIPYIKKSYMLSRCVAIDVENELNKLYLIES